MSHIKMRFRTSSNDFRELNRQQHLCTWYYNQLCQECRDVFEDKDEFRLLSEQELSNFFLKKVEEKAPLKSIPLTTIRTAHHMVKGGYNYFYQKKTHARPKLRCAKHRWFPLHYSKPEISFTLVDEQTLRISSCPDDPNDSFDVVLHLEESILLMPSYTIKHLSIHRDEDNDFYVCLYISRPRNKRERISSISASTGNSSISLMPSKSSRAKPHEKRLFRRFSEETPLVYPTRPKPPSSIEDKK